MKYKISIPEPCHEDWNKMTPNEKGRFCDSCEKTIIDFSNYSKTELAKRINSGENMCGRFKPEQLNTPLNYHGPLYLKGANWILSLAGLVAVSAPVLSQSSVIQSSALSELLENKDEYFVSEPDKDTLVLKSTVRDAMTGEGLPFALVQVKGQSKRFTETDINGKFRLAVKNNMEVITLVITRNAYDTKEVVVDLKMRNLSAVIFLNSAQKEMKIEEANRKFTLIKSTVVDSETKETIPFASIRLLIDNEVFAGAETDFDGNFEIRISPTTKKFIMELTNSSFEKVEMNVNLDKAPIPEQLEMSIDKTESHLIMGGYISVPVHESTNNYLQEQARKYYR